MQIKTNEDKNEKRKKNQLAHPPDPDWLASGEEKVMSPCQHQMEASHVA